MIHNPLNPDRVGCCLLIDNAAGINCTCRLDQQDVTLLFGNRLVRHALRHDKQFTLIQRQLAIMEMKIQFAVNNKKYLVRFRMVVLDEFSLHFRQFEMIIVHLRDDFG